MNQPLTQTRLRPPPPKKGGESSKNSSTLGDISPNTHSDLRGGYEADHSDISDDAPNADDKNNTSKAEIKQSCGRGCYSAKGGRSQPS